MRAVGLLSKKNRLCRGFTITELMVSVFIISLAVALLHGGLMGHLRTLRVASLVQEAQDLAFAELWQRHDLSYATLRQMVDTSPHSFNTPESFLIGTRGEIRFAVLPDSADQGHLTLVCQVWAPPLVGYGNHYRTPQELIEYQIERYDR